MPFIRKEPKSKSGWNNGDIDVAIQLFSCGMVWDGNLVSKESRDHFVEHGYAVRHEGMQSLTGKGIVALIRSKPVQDSLRRRARAAGENPLIADPARIKRAMT